MRDTFTELFKTTLYFLADSAGINQSQARVLVVEGTTDADFLRHILKIEVICMPVYEFKYCFNSLLDGHMTAEEMHNNKKFIEYFTKQIMPNSLILYGMVDLDYKKASEYERYPNLFVTDTSDLETLLLKTDPNLLQRIGEKRKFNLKTETLNKIYIQAYYYGKVKAALMKKIRKYELQVNEVLKSSADIDYGVFFTTGGNGIVIRKIIQYIAKTQGQQLTNEEETEYCQRTIDGDKLLEVEATGTDFCCKWQESTPDGYVDFWTVVNGHVLLKMLMLINEHIQVAYGNNDEELNRNFEENLIDDYNYEKLRETKLYGKMSREGLIRQGS